MNESRRNFLRSSARLLMFGGVVAFAAAQEAKRRRLQNDPGCVRLNPCAECAKFQTCTLPKANAARSPQRPFSSSATALFN